MFDGKTTAGWRNYGKTEISSGWVVQDGALTRTGCDCGAIVICPVGVSSFSGPSDRPRVRPKMFPDIDLNHPAPGAFSSSIPVAAAKKYGSKAWGFDINPVRVKESLENVEKNNVKNLVTIKLQDIFELDLSKADVITLYLLPTLNVKLIPQLDKLKPGCRIVSHDL